MARLNVDSVLHDGLGVSTARRLAQERSGGREFKPEDSAGTYRAVNLHGASMLLHDAIAYGKAETCALVLAISRLGLGGEEWIEDTLQVFRRDASAEILYEEDDTADGFAGGDADARVGGAMHGVASVEQKVESDLLQLALVAVNPREARVELRFHANAGGLELMLKQCEGVVEEAIEIDGAELSAAGT